MPNTLSNADMKAIINALPADQIEHMNRVKEKTTLLCSILSRRNYFENSDANIYIHFGEAAYYHDIGKAWVPQKLLSKSGKLTDEEMRLVKKHTLFAEELFARIRKGAVSGMPEYIVPLAHDAAVYHQEQWNGMGYPYGLMKEQIPLVARITSICDSYDAITNDRAYRKAQSHAFACHEIEVHAGTQFDPELTKVFLANEALFSDK